MYVSLNAADGRFISVNGSRSHLLRLLPIHLVMLVNIIYILKFISIEKKRSL